MSGLTSKKVIYLDPDRGKTACVMPESINFVAFKNDDDKWEHHLGKVALNKDRKSFQLLYENFAPKLKSFFIKQGCHENSEEWVQEVFIRIWQKAHLYKADKALVSTWIFTIARNFRIDELRKKQLKRADEDKASSIASDSDIEEDVFKLEQKSELNNSFDVLTHEHRMVIQKTYFEDKSHSVAAIELGMTEGVVKSRIRSAIKLLKTQLNKRVS